MEQIIVLLGVVYWVVSMSVGIDLDNVLDEQDYGIYYVRVDIIFVLSFEIVKDVANFLVLVSNCYVFRIYLDKEVDV